MNIILSGILFIRQLKNKIRTRKVVNIDTNDKVIDINICNKAKETYRFFKGVHNQIVILRNGQRRNETTVLIMIRQEKDGITKEVVHPVSEYLLQSKKGGKKYSPLTQDMKATLLVKFLNYALIDNAKKFKIENLDDLLFEHGTEFLNDITTDISAATQERYIRYLTDFYYYMASVGVLKNITHNNFTIRQVQTPVGPREVVESPFKGVYWDNIMKPTLIHKLDTSLVLLFIDTAILYAPQIALGICFQMYGGLRIGDVVNLKKSSLSVRGPSGKFGFILNLNNKYMRDDLKHLTGGGSVKKPRRQAVYPYGGNFTQRAYEEHFKNNKHNEKHNALFIDRNKNPMTDDTYRYYFNKVKAKFIERLRKSDNPNLRHYAIELQSVRWSTHIGRGTFSNIVASVSNNILEIAQARGDDNPSSSLVYLSDSDRMALLLYENDKEMWEMLEKQRTKLEE